MVLEGSQVQQSEHGLVDLCFVVAHGRIAVEVCQSLMMLAIAPTEKSQAQEPWGNRGLTSSPPPSPGQTSCTDSEKTHQWPARSCAPYWRSPYGCVVGGPEALAPAATAVA